MNYDDSNGSWDSDTAHARDTEREPFNPTRRQRIPLNELGTLRADAEYRKAYLEAVEQTKTWLDALRAAGLL